ncbi:hypothetical protein H5410_046905 [Solanum commersonii]|uniref:Putative plant transposon protein domain-containing protein n=1 Tax=Solanum commersonii TaxID=4109 RepID=A0A9J5XFQ1_SOLCO|nr:hypothetical protein H5410_046905 [Solanum commersonii]
MEFIFAEPNECNLHMVRGVDVTLTPTVLNDIVGTSPDADPLIKHSTKRFHQSISYAHMIQEAWVRLKIVMNYLIPGLHYTNISRDRLCLVYALMTPTELNIGDVLKSAMRKAQVHKGYIYAFGGIITQLCHAAMNILSKLGEGLEELEDSKGFNSKILDLGLVDSSL